MRKFIILLIFIAFILPTVLNADKDCQGMCGDANGDGRVNISDVIYLLNYIFIHGPEPQPVLACGDANSDCATADSDVVFIVNYIFIPGSPSPGDCSPGCWGDGDCCPFVPSD